MVFIAAAKLDFNILYNYRVNIGVEDNFFLHRYISSNSKVPASRKVASANWISVSN